MGSILGVGRKMTGIGSNQQVTPKLMTPSSKANFKLRLFYFNDFESGKRRISKVGVPPSQLPASLSYEDPSAAAAVLEEAWGIRTRSEWPGGVVHILWGISQGSCQIYLSVYLPIYIQDPKDLQC